MSFVPVRFEALCKTSGYVQEVHPEVLVVVVRRYFPEEEPPADWVMDLKKEGLPEGEVAKCVAGTYIDFDVGYHYDRFGTCRRGVEFRADVRGSWTEEDLQRAKAEATKLSEVLGWDRENA